MDDDDGYEYDPAQNREEIAELLGNLDRQLTVNDLAELTGRDREEIQQLLVQLRGQGRVSDLLDEE